MEKFSNKKKLKYSGVTSFFLLCIVPSLYLMGFTELSFDETYYWIYSKYLNFGYFDHPPMVGLGIKIGTLIFGQNEFGVRAMSLMSFFGTILLLLKITNAKLSDNSFWFLLLVFPLMNLSAVFALPDSYMLFFGTLYFYAIKKYLKAHTVQMSLLVSFAIAGMFYSKYHGLLIVLLTVLALPGLAKKKSFYFIVVMVLILYFPHMFWQYQNDFISFKYHLFGRAEKHFELKNILDYVFGQLALMGFPLFIYACFKFKKVFDTDEFSRVLIFNSFGFLLFLFFLSFRNQIEANWSLTCAIAFFILIYEPFKRKTKKLLMLGSFNIGLNTLLKFALIFLPFLAGLDIKDNRFNEIYGWKNGRVLDIKKLCGNRKIVGDNYQVTSKMAFYTNSPEIPAMHFGSRSSHYELLNLEKSIKKDTPICYLTSKNLEGSIKIETKYKDPVYVVNNMTFADLLLRYKANYEEIIRN